MDLKQFLKPDKRKITFFVIILVMGVITVISSKYYQSLMAGEKPFWLDEVLATFTLIFTPLNTLAKTWEEIPISFLENLVYFYILSCCIFWIYDSIKKEDMTNSFNRKIFIKGFLITFIPGLCTFIMLFYFVCFIL